MPFDSKGQFTRVHNWDEDRENNIDIVSDRHDEEDDNFANGLSDTFLRDGRAIAEGDFQMGGFQIKNMADGISERDAVNRKQLNDFQSQINNILKQVFKVGDLKQSLQTANHQSWLLCNGQAVSRSAYPLLFSLIGTNFGAGDGINTFNVPDYRGKFLRGLGGNSESDFYKTQAEGLPNIKGECYPMRFAGDQTVQGAFYNLEKTTTGKGSDSHNFYNKGTGFDASKSNGIYGANAHVTPINQAVNIFIRAKEEF